MSWIAPLSNDNAPFDAYCLISPCIRIDDNNSFNRPKIIILLKLKHTNNDKISVNHTRKNTGFECKTTPYKTRSLALIRSTVVFGQADTFRNLVLSV